MQEEHSCCLCMCRKHISYTSRKYASCRGPLFVLSDTMNVKYGHHLKISFPICFGTCLYMYCIYYSACFVWCIYLSLLFRLLFYSQRGRLINVNLLQPRPIQGLMTIHPYIGSLGSRCLSAYSYAKESGLDVCENDTLMNTDVQ